MGMADIAEVLWRDFLSHNPGNPDWFNRDRFVLSNGHGSMLIYSLLHLSGYALPCRSWKTSVSCIQPHRVTRSTVTPRCRNHYRTAGSGSGQCSWHGGCGKNPRGAVQS